MMTRSLLLNLRQAIQRPAPSALHSPGLERVLADLSIQCLDVGARSGVEKTLLPLSSVINFVCFEPDEDECSRLDELAAKDSGPWRSVRFVPVALGAPSTDRSFYLYRARGCSSLLEANIPLARDFGVAHWFEIDAQLKIATVPLDEAAERFELTDAAYMKIDIQGAELEVLQSGRNLLERSVLAIKTEVEFFPIYKGQPLFHELDAFMSSHGFIPLAFLHVQHWRRGIQAERSSPTFDVLPYSRPELAHGDVLYFRRLDGYITTDEQGVKQCLKGAFLALAYGHIDYAASLLRRPAVRDFINYAYALDLDDALFGLSKRFGRHAARSEAYAALRNLVSAGKKLWQYR